jgi:hypothetical protein
MKKVFLTAVLGVLVFSNVAKADHQCTGYSNEKKLFVDENNITDFGDTSILLVEGEKQTQLFGIKKVDFGLLLSKTTFAIYPFSGDTLTIVSKPKSCGRGSCDYNADPIVSASLKIGDTTSYFYCGDVIL